MAETSSPSAADLLAVRSRVSWGAIAAGAMVALTIYVVLTMLGVALGLEMALRGSGADLGAGAAIYSILVLLLAMFFGGWATSRLAVGESKLEAVLYGLILWGVLFLVMLWLLSFGMRTGFGALFGAASGAYATEEGRIDFNRVARDLKQAGVDEATVNKYRGYYERVRDNPGDAADVSREMSGDAGARQVARQASWWSLAGLLVSLATVILGSLVGSGELLQPVPILGVRRTPQRPA
jgi:ABC-type transport system involved in multi-copper enzyme maturation permease subunit